MALVAYDGSCSSSEDEDDLVPVPASISSSTALKDSDNSKATSSSDGAGVPNKGVLFSKFIDDEVDDDVPLADGEDALEQALNSNDDGNRIWSKLLPQPKKVPPPEASEIEDDVEIGPIPPKKTYGDEELPEPPKPSSIPSLSSTKFKGKVRISVPFLNSLEEVESSEDVKRKYVEPSKKGSGLFAILPQPKNSASYADSNFFLKSKTKPQAAAGSSLDSNQSSPSTSSSATPSVNKLIPDAVKNRLKRPAPGKLTEIRAKLSKRRMAVSSAADSDDSDDGEGGFFSLDDTDTVDPEALEKLKLPTPNFEKKQETPVYESMEVDDEGQDYRQQQATSSRSEDLMKFLQPKRGRKEDVQIIDINADDLRPDNTEWLKNITDESAAPVRRGKGLSGTVKRKHQITYLAFEAKAREQELKNQWAQNHANKMATKNKYGF